MSTLTAEIFDQVKLASVLSEVETIIRKYMVLTADQTTLAALWTAQTHATAAFDYVAYLNIKSPMPECGKTRLLEVLEALVAHPWLTGRVTAAVLMRKVDAEHPVLLLDESDAAFSGEKEYAEALRGMLNSGFHRSGKASACVGQGANLTYKDFSTFGPKAIAGIDKLPSTVESRSIPIALKRRTKAETITKWRRRAAWADVEPLRLRLASVMKMAIETLKVATPSIPEGLSDRAEDVIEPLFSIADLAGADWPERSRRAALALMGTAARVAQESDQHLGLELLADIQCIFGTHDNPEALWTEQLIEGLKGLDDRPWATCIKGDKPINAHRLSRMLKGFGVHSAGDVRLGERVKKGYRLATFEDAFARYIPPPPLEPDFKPRHRNNANNDGPKTAKIEPLHEAPVAVSKTAVSPDKHWGCCDVALSNPDTGDRPEDDHDADHYFGA